MEAVFLLLFLGGVGFFVSNLLWLTVSGKLLFYEQIIPRPQEGNEAEWTYDWDDFRSVMLGLAGAVGGTFGLYQLKNSATRTRLTRFDTATKRDAERNERFVRAVELLKDDDEAVRMGGIFALERLATEDGGAYHDAVVKVLGGYIRFRTNARDKDDLPTYPPRRRFEAFPKHLFASLPPYTGDRAEGLWIAVQLRQTPVNEVLPLEPVKAALETLSGLTGHMGAQNRPPADLRGAWLVGVDAMHLTMTGWRLDGANLNFATLTQAHLEGADFRRAHLEGATLDGAHLEGAVLWKAHLEGANLSRADLKDADLGHVHLEGARLSQIHLEDAFLMGAHLDGAFLIGAHLEGATLRFAHLDGADLALARLQGVSFLRAKGVTKAQLDSAVWPTGAPPSILPDGFTPDMFDKGWCTDPADPKRLLPDRELVELFYLREWSR